MIAHRLRPKPDKSIPFLIFLTFLGTFVVSRLFIAIFPELFIPIRGEHVHHFAYGIILLSLVGFVSIVYPLTSRSRIRLSVLYGIALGLAFDEFAMWLQLDDVYHDRLSYDAIVIISLLLLNFIYFSDFWKKWGYRLGKLFRIIFLWVPVKTLRLITHHFWQPGQK